MCEGVDGIHLVMNGAGRGKEGVAVLMNKEWYYAMSGYKCSSPRTLRVNYKYARVILSVCVCVMGGRGLWAI